MSRMPETIEGLTHNTDLSAANWAEAERGNLRKRRLVAKLFRWLCLSFTLVAIILLAALLIQVVYQGAAHVDWQFLTSFGSRHTESAGIKAALVGSLWLIGFTAMFALPIGIGAAIYLEEFAGRSRVNTFIEVNIANLAGVPSVVYGILGLAIFVRGVALGQSVLAGALTMTLLILPIIIIASRESIRAVPQSIRHAAFALGASRWQTTASHVLPAAAPGIMTSIILALSRAMGETAPLIMIGALTYVAFVPQGPLDSFTVLPIQIFNWVSRPQPEFHGLAAAGIIVLLAVLMSMNAVAIFLRYRFDRRFK